jgi:hypothetical protein
MLGAYTEQLGVGGKLHTTWAGFLWVMFAARQSTSERAELIGAVIGLELKRGFGTPPNIPIHCKFLRDVNVLPD